MTVYADSRYATGELTTVQLPNGAGNVMLTPLPVNLSPSLSFFFYTIQQGDRIDLLAGRFLGDTTHWWMIIDLNPETDWPTDLVPGQVLRMPIATPQSTTGVFPASGLQSG